MSENRKNLKYIKNGIVARFLVFSIYKLECWHVKPFLIIDDLELDSVVYGMPGSFLWISNSKNKTNIEKKRRVESIPVQRINNLH